MKKILKKIIKSLGYEVRKIEAVNYDTGIHSNLNNFNVVDLEKLSLVNSKIDGMISDYQGKVIFLLCNLIFEKSPLPSGDLKFKNIFLFNFLISL